MLTRVCHHSKWPQAQQGLSTRSLMNWDCHIHRRHAKQLSSPPASVWRDFRCLALCLVSHYGNSEALKSVVGRENSTSSLGANNQSSNRF